LAKYAAIAILYGSSADNQPEQLQDLIDNLNRLAATYSPDGLSHYGLTKDNLAPILQNCRSGSMLGNPLTLSDQALKEALNTAL
jgi:alcohol dehydrogenase